MSKRREASRFSEVCERERPCTAPLYSGLPGLTMSVTGAQRGLEGQGNGGLLERMNGELREE